MERHGAAPARTRVGDAAAAARAARAFAATRARARPSSGGPATPAAANAHARRGHDGDAVPREAGAHAEVEGVVDGRERRIESVERLPDGVPHEDGGRIEAEHVAESVVLALVELVGDDGRRSGRGA